MANTNHIITEIDNPNGLNLKDLCQTRLDQLDMINRNEMTLDQLRDIKEEIIHLCYMLHVIEVYDNEKSS